jgi:hypothetical protein
VNAAEAAVQLKTRGTDGDEARARKKERLHNWHCVWYFLLTIFLPEKNDMLDIALWLFMASSMRVDEENC